METRDAGSLIPRKLVEAAFRHLWLLLVPIIALPLAVVLLTRPTDSYRSSSTIWVQKNDAVDSGPLGRDGNPYLTAAQNQVQVLNDLMSTVAFRSDVAIAAKIIPAAASEQQIELATDYIAQTVSVSVVGTNLIALSVSTPIPQESYLIARAFIDTYLLRAAEEATRDADILARYYDEQLVLAEKELAARRATLDTYVLKSPRTSPESRGADAEYDRLLAFVEQQNILVRELSTKRFEVELTRKSAGDARNASFSVQDAPKLATAPETTKLTSQLAMPIAGLIFGICISAAYLYIVYRMDTTIRTKEDLEGLAVPMLGYVPEIRRGAGIGLWQYTPLAWLMQQRQRGYARKVAASIASIPVQQGRA